MMLYSLGYFLLFARHFCMRPSHLLILQPVIIETSLKLIVILKLVTFNSFIYYVSVDSVAYNNSLKKINNTVKAIVPANLVYCFQAFK